VLQEIHAVILVNATVNTLTALSQKYIFAPIDSFLLTSISNDFNGYLASLKNDRGLENYLVECDNGNNSAVDRQNRTVNVNYWIIPLNALYKLNVTCTVQASGSTLAVVTSTPITAG
jgi:phage tail sheath protein FI